MRNLIVSLLLLSACSTPASETPPATCAPANVIAAVCLQNNASDVGLMALDGGSTFYKGGKSLGGDPVLASSHGRLFWIDRSLGRVFELDPRCASPLGPFWSANDDDGNAGEGSDPQDLAVDPASGNLWIARYMVPTILVKSSDGSTPLGTIDLSGVANPPRNPRMSSIRVIGAKAYVTLEMLDAFSQPTHPSLLVRIDVATRQIEATLVLQGRNPFGLIVEDDADNALYLAEPGDTKVVTDVNAGIERVDLATFTSKLIVRESDIGASVDQVSITKGCGTAIVMGPAPENVTSMISFDPSTGAILTPLSKKLLYTSAGFELAGMAWLDGGVNLVGDGTGVSEKGYPVHLLKASSGCELTEEKVSLFTPLPPVAFQPIP